jgi:hypothetical protein
VGSVVVQEPDGRQLDSPDERLRVSVVIPCLNEAENIAECVLRARQVLRENQTSGEVLVVDNASTDGSGDLARAVGAIVVEEPRRGYGNAYHAGFARARGNYIIMADADLTYDFGDIPRFVDQLEQGADIVIGDRMRHIHPGAMPWLNRHVGNPAMTGLVQGMFNAGVSDAWCGMRGLRRDILPRLDLRSDGMEFAVEMVIRATDEELEMRELPIELHPRGGTSKLSPFRDGWRTIHLMLAYSPRHLFMIPGLLMMLLGGFAVSVVLADVSLFGRHWYMHTLIAGALFAIVGVQVLGLGLCAEAFATHFLGKRGTLYEDLVARGVRLRHGLVAGGACLAAGMAVGSVVFATWAAESFDALSEQRLAVVSSTLFIVGVQVVFVSLLISMLDFRGRRY